MRSATILAAVAAMTSQACLDGLTGFEEKPYVGPRGLQGLEGEVQGEKVALSSRSATYLGAFLVWSEQYDFANNGWLVAEGGALMDETSYAIDLAFLRMPSKGPLAGNWLCAGAGSEYIRYADGTHEIHMKNLSVMGSCADAAAGPYVSTLYRGGVYANGIYNDSWTGSPELQLTGTYIDGMSCGDLCYFSGRTDSGSAWAWFLPSEGMTELQDRVPMAVQEGTLLLPDQSGDYMLACAGGDSSLTQIEVGPDAFDYELKLTGISLVGRCPGTPIEGSLVNRYYYDP